MTKLRCSRLEQINAQRAQNLILKDQHALNIFVIFQPTLGELVINRSHIFKFLLLVTLLIISYLVFSRPGYNQSIPHIDKIGHFGSFFILSALSHLAFRPRWYVLFFGLIAYAGMIEIVQSYLPYRSASWADFAADILGIIGFYLLLLGYQKQRAAK